MYFGSVSCTGPTVDPVSFMHISQGGRLLYVYGGYLGRGWERNVASSYQQHPHLISAPDNGY